MKKVLSLAIISIFFLGGKVIAQKEINNVLKIDLNNNFIAIENGDDITGYAAFYKADKVKRGEYSYHLSIMNENAEEVAEKKFTASESLFLLDAQYNGELLGLKFADYKERKILLKFFDENAEQVANKSYEMDKLERRALSMSIQTETRLPQSLFAVENQGFLDYRTIDNKKQGFSIKYYPNDKTKKGWTYASKVESPIIETVSLLEANENIVLNMMLHKKNLLSSDAEYWLAGIDPESGDEMFKVRIENSKYEESITNSFYDKNSKKINLFGFYFEKGENPTNGRSLGMVMSTMTLDGKIEGKKYISWATDVAKFLPANAKGKIKEIGFVYFHNFVQSADGSVTGVGESFNKTVSAAGTAMKALALASGGTGSGSAFQITIGDFYFFEFDKDFNLTGVEVFEKDKTRFALPAGGAYYGPQVMALLTKTFGGFDFSYLKTMDEGNTFLVFYQDFERRKGEKNNTVVGVISSTDGEYVQDKVDFNTEADLVRALPAQAGNVLFLEYFKKEKQLDMKFQKMNY